ncbi:MAG: hypothetical protein ACR5LD_04385 [Symbiopectobacterium sp.]
MTQCFSAPPGGSHCRSQLLLSPSIARLKAGDNAFIRVASYFIPVQIFTAKCAR